MNVAGMAARHLTEPAELVALADGELDGFLST
jgi:hypothetical protein